MTRRRTPVRPRAAGGTVVDRLDRALVARGLATSRTRAADLVAAGRVTVDGAAATRSAAPVPAAAVLALRPGPPAAVSRGGCKLAAALESFGGDLTGPLAVAGRRCLDAGASTGGFTEVLLRAGAVHVAAVDVGHGQLAPSVAADPRVTAYEGTTVRGLRPEVIGGRADLTVADLSFISLRLVLADLAACTTADGDLVLLVKPQFEVGRELLGPGGVVREPVLHGRAVAGVVDAGTACGLGVRGLVRSPLTGQHGNVELLLWLGPGGHRVEPARAIDVATGVATGGATG